MSPRLVGVGLILAGLAMIRYARQLSQWRVDEAERRFQSKAYFLRHPSNVWGFRLVGGAWALMGVAALFMK